MADMPPGFDTEIDFVADWSDQRVFSDLKQVAKVDDPSKMLEQWRLKPIAPGTGGAEATVGRLDMVNASLLTLLAEHSRSVCRLVVPGGDYTNYLGQPAIQGWYGTAFLVSPNILLTNHHVLNSIAVAQAARAEFNYQITQQDLVDGPPDNAPSAVTFQLNPDRLFLTSKMADFDYTFVWIEAAAAQQFGSITMTRGSFTVRQTEPTYIIHHPGGAPKQASLDDTEVLSINSSAVLYAADTAGGSSGAPVFCKRGRLVALHHAWRSTAAIKAMFPTLTGRLNDGGSTNVVNEGIKLSAIAIDLEGKIASGGAETSAAATVLTAFRGSDTMTGLFGSLGRHRAGSSESTGPSAYEQVVQVYQGSEMDIDIGAWNIEWFNREFTDERKLDRVATIITDLNLDIWALVEVSPDAVKALVERLRKKFRQEYHAAFSEPDAKTGKQTAAVLWRPNVVEGTREDWPADLDALFRLDSRDDLPFEAVHGKIFSRYPGLFRFKLKSEAKAFDFYLVPLHLKAMSEGSLRRRMASKALSYAVTQMVEQHGKDADWVLLGDVNATLASQDFDPLVSGGFTPLSASDEANGAFTYLKAPYKSLIDNIFVSANMSKVVDEEDFYIVATDRAVSRFVQDTSDHRPIAMRLSLSDLPDVAAPGAQAGTAAVADVFDQMLSHAGLAAPAPDRVAAPMRAENGGAQSWLVGDRDKIAFFKDNETALINTIAAVNAALPSRFGAGAMPLTREDVAVVYMAEAGFTAGKIDPGFIHSNGEFGLFPLPSNIDFWVGGGAPVFNLPMTLDDNVRFYLAYLAALKNKPVKTVAGRTLYPDLFNEPGIAGDAARQAKMLAGVVHGYFFSGNFSDGVVPTQDILQGYVADTPLGPLMANTTYVHAGKPLLDGRQANLDDALRLLV
jgi:endonuclease/exonuclease/phosphatase family metal-dependent hydrolase